MDILNLSLILSSVLLTAALSSMFADKIGDISFWVNGSMIMGALTYCIVGSKMSDNFFGIFVSAICAMLISGLLTLIHFYATVKLKANFILSATTINILSPAIAMTIIPIVAPKLQEGSSSFSNPFSNSVFMNISGLTTQNVFWFITAITIAILIFLYFKFTKIGKRHISIGENPNAADAASIPVNKYKMVVLFIAGALAGLSGSMLMSEMPNFSGSVNGYGFIALAIVILGQWRTLITIIVAILFGVIWVYISYNNSIVNIPTEFLQMIPFALSLFSMVFLERFSRAPKSQGLHFSAGRR